MCLFQSSRESKKEHEKLVRWVQDIRAHRRKWEKAHPEEMEAIRIANEKWIRLQAEEEAKQQEPPNKKTKKFDPKPLFP